MGRCDGGQIIFLIGNDFLNCSSLFLGSHVRQLPILSPPAESNITPPAFPVFYFLLPNLRSLRSPTSVLRLQHLAFSLWTLRCSNLRPPVICLARFHEGWP